MEPSISRIAVLIAAIFGPAVYSQSPDDPAALLDRAREKIAATTERLLKFTCVETIDRSYYAAPSLKIRPKIMTEAPANSCDGKEFGGSGPLSLDAKDRLRLGVTVSGDKEIYSWAAASRFDSRSVFEMVPSGPVSMGSFGTYLVDIFENPGTRIRFSAKKKQGAAEVFEYTFEVPAESSHYGIGAEHGWDITSYHGSFQIYSATAELVSLTEETAQLPPGARMCRARTRINYHYTIIGGDEFLIPRESQVDTLTANANETSSITTFSGCREYAAESSLRFDSPESESAHQPILPVPAPLPPGLSLTLTLTESINPLTAAAGDAVSAKLTSPVRALHSDEILLPAGAIAHGRILLMQHQYSSSRFVISLRFESIEGNGMVTPLSLQWDRQLKADKAATRFRNRAPEFSLPPSDTRETGGFFSVPATHGVLVLPAGFKSKWITVSP